MSDSAPLERNTLLLKGWLMMLDTSAKQAPVKAEGGRLALVIVGLAAVGFGIAVLVWPTKAAVTLTGILAVYAVVAGIVYVAMSFLSKNLGVGGRLGHLFLGVLYIIAGAYAFSSLQKSAAFLAVFLTVMVGVMWIMEGFTSLFTLNQSESKALTVAFAVLSLIAGVTLLSSPLWGAVFLWWMVGLSMVILGGMNVLRGLKGKRT